MALSAKQIKCAEYMVFHPEMSNEQIAKEVPCNIKTLYLWKKQEEFQNYIHYLCETRFKDIEKLAVEKLQQNIAKGNQKAIEYALNYLGYKPVEKQEITTNEIKIDIVE